MSEPKDDQIERMYESGFRDGYVNGYENGIKEAYREIIAAAKCKKCNSPDIDGKILEHTHTAGNWKR